jgi:hypothetical protein
VFADKCMNQICLWATNPRMADRLLKSLGASDP